ncbi:EF-hand calcium-binding domain-containing protein 14 isoform X2 [Hetaerina americana]|uniref:EF-hand calcium-binding domain-containing protein 14 isoform X2 n=1 Tax=Hetaerina americana TaxID=62018 RepID=UPI003A7F5589
MPLMMENNNKEAYNLLDTSGSYSESGSEIREFVHPPKKKKLKRRLRASHGISPSDDDSQRGGNGHGCIACRIGRAVSIWLAIALLLLWLLMLAWLGLRLHGQLARLNSDVEQVVAGSKGVPDALQKCHSMSKELQHNQTILLAQLMTLSSQVTNFSIQVKEVHHGLSEVEDRLKGAPELVRVPQELAELSKSVGQLGSSVGGLDASVSGLKSSNTILRNETDTLHQEVANLKEALLQLSNVSANAASSNMEGGGSADMKSEDDLEKLLTALRQDVFELKANLSHMNETLAQKLLSDEKDNAHQGEMSGVLSNTTARVGILETSLTKDFSELSDTIDQIATQVNDTLHQIESQIAQLTGRMNEKSTKNISIERDSTPTSTSKPTSEGQLLNKSTASIISEKSSSISTDKTQNTTSSPQVSVNDASTSGGTTSTKSSEVVGKSK